MLLLFNHQIEIDPERGRKQRRKLNEKPKSQAGEVSPLTEQRKTVSDDRERY